MWRVKSGSKGLSLIELMLTLLITTVLAACTAPSFRNLMDRVNLTTTASQFQFAVSIARSEARRRGMRVDLIPAKGRDWSRGWVVIVDANNNQQADAGELILHVSAAMPSGLSVIAGLRDPRPYLAFDPSGRPRSIASSAVPQIGAFVFSVGTMKRKIIIGFLGRVRCCNPDKDAATC